MVLILFYINIKIKLIGHMMCAIMEATLLYESSAHHLKVACFRLRKARGNITPIEINDFLLPILFSGNYMQDYVIIYFEDSDFNGFHTNLCQITKLKLRNILKLLNIHDFILTIVIFREHAEPVHKNGLSKPNTHEPSSGYFARSQ